MSQFHAIHACFYVALPSTSTGTTILSYRHEVRRRVELRMRRRAPGLKGRDRERVSRVPARTCHRLERAVSQHRQLEMIINSAVADGFQHVLNDCHQSNESIRK